MRRLSQLASHPILTEMDGSDAVRTERNCAECTACHAPDEARSVYNHRAFWPSAPIKKRRVDCEHLRYYVGGKVPEPTTAEVQRMLLAPKQIGESVRWRPQVHGRTRRGYFVAEVVALDTPDVLKLHGACSAAKWGFSLVWSNVPIRRLDHSPQGHRNPDGTIHNGRHKHTWSNLHRDREVYVPTDIDFSDINAAFLGFLVCGVNP